MDVILFDDKKRENFYPLTLNRSTGDLRCGILKLRQRILAYFGEEETKIILAKELEELYLERHPDWIINDVSKGEHLFINTRIKFDTSFLKKIESLQLDEILVYNENILAAKTDKIEGYINSETLEDHFSGLKKIEISEIGVWNYLWELIHENGSFIKSDFEKYFYDRDNKFDLEMGVTALNPYNIWIGEEVKIKPGVVLDASEGPIVIDEKAEIMPNAVLIGPAYIGKGSKIKVGAKIYEGTSIGPVCKIGGEVEDSLVLGYSNKQHDGFLGHSYLGEWVNLGADTNNSDLKNNYKEVKTYFYPRRSKIGTGSQFVGAIIGDHSKTGINSTINTGTVIGIGCNLFGREIIKDFVPSFSWGELGNFSNYKYDKFIETAETVKKRRKKEMGKAEKDLYAKIAKNI